jgi:two-component system sensor histidine kinase/response regulator
MGGLQTLEAIRERQKDLEPITVIALTGYSSEPDRQRLLRAGFDSVIGKPFRLDALDALLRDSSGESIPKREKLAATGRGETPVKSLLDRVGGDEKLVGKMIATFLHDTPQRVAAIEKALKQKNAEKLASVAHALKGSIGIFSARAAGEYSEKLQDLGRAKDFSGTARLYEQLKEEIAKLEANLRGYAGQKPNRSPRQGASPKTKRRSSKPKR